MENQRNGAIGDIADYANAEWRRKIMLTDIGYGVGLNNLYSRSRLSKPDAPLLAQYIFTDAVWLLRNFRVNAEIFRKKLSYVLDVFAYVAPVFGVLSINASGLVRLVESADYLNMSKKDLMSFLSSKSASYQINVDESLGWNDFFNKNASRGEAGAFNTILGTTKSDVINSYDLSLNASDIVILDGGSGDDVLVGGREKTIYRFEMPDMVSFALYDPNAPARGFGNDIVKDFGRKKNDDVVFFSTKELDVMYDADSLLFSRVGSALQISIRSFGGSQNSVTLVNQFRSPQEGFTIQQIRDGYPPAGDYAIEQIKVGNNYGSAVMLDVGALVQAMSSMNPDDSKAAHSLNEINRLTDQNQVNQLAWVDQTIVSIWL